MQTSVYDLKAFYDSKVGRIVRRILRERITEFWPDFNGMRVMGYGYASPYLRRFTDTAERTFAIMPQAQGAHHWPRHPGEKNLVALASEDALPIETESIDRILMVHALEYEGNIHPNLDEIWRVLKSTGRVLFIVPNRRGFWAHSEWSPFGQGTPFSVSQLCYYLKEHNFIHERTEEALFMPPVKSSMLLKSAGMIESLGKTLLPFAAGVHMVEVSKQLYATNNRGGGSKVGVMEGVMAPGRKSASGAGTS